MPRKAKSRAPAMVTPYNNGEATQAPHAPTGMPYGEHKALIDSQQSAPLAAAGGLPTPSAPPPQAADPLAAASAMAPGGGMFAPTARPNEPVTHGLPVGPGAGPEILPQSTPNVSMMLRRLAQATGSPMFAQLADQAEMQGQ